MREREGENGIRKGNTEGKGGGNGNGKREGEQ